MKYTIIFEFVKFFSKKSCVIRPGFPESGLPHRVGGGEGASCSFTVVIRKV